MTVDEFRAWLAQHQYSQAAFAKLVGAADRTVQQWATGQRAIPATVDTICRLLETRSGVTPPPHGSHPAHDRDEPCCQAIDPHLDLLAKQARAVGWIEPEIVAAVLSWVVDTTIENAGQDAARELLTDALEVVYLSGSIADIELNKSEI